MSDRHVIERLLSIADATVHPPRPFVDDLWRRIESELDSDTSASLIAEPASHPETHEETGVDVAVAPLPVRWSSQNSAWTAAAAFALVLGVGLITWWLLPPGADDVGNTDRDIETFTAPGAVELAIGDMLWPAQDMAGTPSSVAEAFAREVLGWNQAAAAETEHGTCLTYPSRDAEVCPTDATTVTLVQRDVDPLPVTLITYGGNETERLWGVAQVGSGYTADRLESVDIGTRIPLPRVEEAARADITMRLANVEELIEVRAAAADLDTGFVDTELVSDPGEVLSVLIRYRDTDGHVISATGGPWNEFYEWPEPEPAGPEITIAEGTYEGSALVWQMSAFHTTDGDLCIRIESMGCIGDMPPGEHLGAFLTSSGFEAGQESRWCVFGTVRDADAVQLRLPDGSQTTAPVFTNPDFDVDFYAHCSLGDGPASQVTALDRNGNILDVVPETGGN